MFRNQNAKNYIRDALILKYHLCRFHRFMIPDIVYVKDSTRVPTIIDALSIIEWILFYSSKIAG